MKDASNKERYKKLYLYGKKNQRDKNLMEEKYHQDQIKPLLCQSTKSIVNKKEKSFKQIVKLLDGDEAVLKISSAHINTSGLPKKYFKNFGYEQLYLFFQWNERRQLTNFEEEAKKFIIYSKCQI